MQSELHSLGKLSNADSQTQQVIARNTSRKIRNRLLHIVDSRTLDSEHISLVIFGRLDELVEGSTGVVGEFLEEGFGFVFCKSPHFELCLCCSLVDLVTVR